MDPFIFEAAPDLVSKCPDAFVAVVPDGVASEAELFETYQRVLQLPDYFGRNWNALFDCLRDFSWIPQRAVVIVHEAVPVRLVAADLKIYLEVLEGAVAFWREPDNPEHSLVVSFPRGDEFSIYRLRRTSDE